LNVAIIGAGVSGLACAHELEKSGIRPVIYERNSFIGEQVSCVASLLEITHRPIKDEIIYMRELFDIDIQPLNTINTIIHKSPNKTAIMKGNFGYFISRGKEQNDLKNQIFLKLKNTEVRFNENVYYDELKEKYDYVIIATGEPSLTDEMGCWQQWFQGYVRSATVLGDFDPNTQIMWINKEYCKTGYAFLAPYDCKRASISLVVSDTNEKEVDHYWEEFLYTENIKYTIVEEFKLQHIAGYAFTHKVDNLYFVGNAGGALDSFLGFGQFNSVEMGVMAARSIVNGDDYDELIKDIVERNKQFYQFRKAFEKLTNDNYDTIVTSIGLPNVKQAVYKSSLNLAKYGAAFLKSTSKE